MDKFVYPTTKKDEKTTIDLILDCPIPNKWSVIRYSGGDKEFLDFTCGVPHSMEFIQGERPYYSRKQVLSTIDCCVFVS